MRCASTPALPAVVAGRTPVQRTREDRQPLRNARDLEPVGRGLDEQLVAARARRRLKDAIGLVGQVLDRAEDPDELIDLVVIRLEVVVADWPVVAEPVDAPAAEIVRAESQRDPPPVIRAPAEHARAEPVEPLANHGRIRLALQRPSAPPGVELAKLALGDGQSSPRRLVGPRAHLRVARGVEHHTRLEHHDVGSGLGEDLGDHSAAGTRADDADVVEGAIALNLHGSAIVAPTLRAGEGRFARRAAARRAGFAGGPLRGGGRLRGRRPSAILASAARQPSQPEAGPSVEHSETALRPQAGRAAERSAAAIPPW